MLQSNLSAYSDGYIQDKGTAIVPNTAAACQPVNSNSIEELFKNCAPFTNCTNEINNTQIDK